MPIIVKITDKSVAKLSYHLLRPRVT